jgi:TonB family protein
MMKQLAIMMGLAMLPGIAGAQTSAPMATKEIAVLASNDVGLDIESEVTRIGKLWRGGDPKVVADAYAKVGFGFPSRAYTPQEHVFLTDWVVATSYSDPVAAQALLDRWGKASPVTDPRSLPALQRLILKTRILIRAGKVAEADTQVKAVRAQLEADRAAAEAKIKAATDKAERRRLQDALDNMGYDRANRPLRAAEFLIATATKGEAAFAQFTGKTRNPFWSTNLKLFVGGREDVNCASAGLETNDWMIASLTFDQKQNTIVALPFAQSRDEVLQPFLETLPEWSITFQGNLNGGTRQHILLRCTKAAPPARDTKPDYDYLIAYFKDRNAAPDANYRFNQYADPLDQLVKDKQFTRLINISRQSNPNAPGNYLRGLALLEGVLKAEAKPDPVALMIISHWKLPTPAAGRVSSVRYHLPAYTTALLAARETPGIPARVLAKLEFKIGEKYEIAGDSLTAGEIYSMIAARAPAELPETSAEYIRAKLRLAALADAAGKKADADAIIAQLGLSPAQCSTYQARPAITKFQTPEYPYMALQDEMQGSVSFEFDLSEAGSPTNFRVISASPPFVFDADTIRSFAKASFAPATRGANALACEAATQTFVWKMPGY